jgi:hypothetical protein
MTDIHTRRREMARIDTKEMETRFTYHKPQGTQGYRYIQIRDKAKDLAYFIVENTPESREQSLAITELEQAIFWANAAIARREVPVE